MGTSHILCIIKDGEHKVSCADRLDGYPSGAGIGILGMLNPRSVEKLRTRIDSCRYLKKDVVERYRNICRNTHEDFYEMLYNNIPGYTYRSGSRLILDILSGDGIVYTECKYDLVFDSLWCEWGYVIDLDRNTFEVYRGMNQEPIDENERFYDGNVPHEAPGGGGYYPLRLVHSYRLDDLPSPDDFISGC